MKIDNRNTSIFVQAVYNLLSQLHEKLETLKEIKDFVVKITSSYPIIVKLLRVLRSPLRFEMKKTL